MHNKVVQKTLVSLTKTTVDMGKTVVAKEIQADTLQISLLYTYILSATLRLLATPICQCHYCLHKVESTSVDAQLV